MTRAVPHRCLVNSRGFGILGLGEKFCQFKGGIVKRYLGTVVLAIACFAIGAGVQRYYDMYRLTRPQLVETAKKPPEAAGATGDKAVVDVSAINFDKEPLWAYGFERPPAPGEKARPQNPPNRNLRPD